MPATEPPIRIIHSPGADVAADVDRLADRCATVDGYRFLSDHLWLDLHGEAGSPLAALARDGEALIGYAQASCVHHGRVVEAAVDPDRRGSHPDLLVALVAALFEAIAGDGGGPVTLWRHDVGHGAEADQIAASLGLARSRELLQLRRTLPTGRAATITTRPFVVGTDEEAVLAVNNRAFADHGEQGGWTPATLQRRERETWFDSDGFRLHERDERLAGFCWTKLHREAGTLVGEIYVIAVDPDFHGIGLGTQLTLAGLAAIEREGAAEAMLYVDAANEQATAMYTRLGFAIARRDLAFSTTLA